MFLSRLFMRRAVPLVLLLVACPGLLRAQIQMPDPKQMSGIPRPVDDLPNGSLSVRLIRGDLSNNIVGHPVELQVGGTVLTARTDDGGRAQFDKLPTGATVKAVAVVDGERLESQTFAAPSQGGIRLMLVATDREKERQRAAEANAPAVSGQVVVGGESRIVMEPGDESISLFYLFEIVNTARAPVNPPTAFAFDMPTTLIGTAILQGSTPNATTSGTHVVVPGPFPPGKTIVQVGGSLPVSSGTLEFTQRLPATFEQLAVIVRKEGDMKLSSPQLQRIQDTTVEGTAVIVGEGGAVAAGQPFTLTLSGLPHHSAVPQRTALILVGLVVLVGIWAARTAPPASASGERQKLVARREKLLQELARLEQDRRRGRGDLARFPARREELVASLEQVYGELDDEDVLPELQLSQRPTTGAVAGQAGVS